MYNEGPMTFTINTFINTVTVALTHVIDSEDSWTI